MDGDSNKEILNELKEMNQSLRSLHEKMDKQEEKVGPLQAIFDMIKSLLIGFLVIGPVIAIIYGLFHILSSYVF